MELCCGRAWENECTHMLYGTYMEVRGQLSKRTLNFHPWASRPGCSHLCLLSYLSGPTAEALYYWLGFVRAGWRKTFMACILNTGLRSCCLFDEEKKGPWPDTLPKGNLFFVHFCTLNGTKGEEGLSCAPIWPFHLSPYTPEILVIQMVPKCH